MSRVEHSPPAGTDEGGFADVFGVPAADPDVEGAEQPPPAAPRQQTQHDQAQASICIANQTRICVIGAGHKGANGVYVAQAYYRGTNKIVLVQERDEAYRIMWVKAKRSASKEQAVYQIRFREDVLYECPSETPLSLPLQAWSTAHVAAGDAPEVVEASSFWALCATKGCAMACWLEVSGAVWAELGCELGTGAKGASTQQVYVDDGDNDEDLSVGNAVLVCPDEEKVRKALGEKWDDRMRGFLGQSLIVKGTPTSLSVVLEWQGVQFEFPESVVEPDYSKMGTFSTHWPIFIVLQTFIVAILWIILAARDHAKDNLPWAKTLGGLESLWPGQTSLLVSKDCRDLRAEIWRWWSYQFSHVGILHVGTNVIMNLLLGVGVEMFHGVLRMAVMYELGVFGGACVYLAADGHRPVVGTSGGCFSLIGIRLAHLALNWAEEPYKYMRLFFLAVLITVNFLVERFNHPEGGVTTSSAAHVGGVIAGLIAGVCMGRNLEARSWERILQGLAVCLGVVAVGYCLGTGLHWPPQNIFDQEPWCWIRQVANATEFGTWDWKCVRCHSDGCIDLWSRQRRIAEASEDMCSMRGGYAFTEG